MKQRTISQSVEVIGIGLHKGEPIKLRLEPLGADSGIIFYREDLATSIPLTPRSVVNTQMATVIGSDKGSTRNRRWKRDAGDGWKRDQFLPSSG